MASVSLRLLVLKTRRLEELRAFYRTLGIDLAEEQHGSGPVHHAGGVGQAVIEIYPLAGEREAADTTTRLGFSVANLAGVVRDLQEVGAVMESEVKQTAWGVRAVVRDPDGRAVELYQA